VVHEGLVLERSLEAARVAETVPRFDADKRGFLTAGTPEGNHGGAELNGDFGIAGLVEQLGTVELALVDLDGVVAPGVVGELHD